MVEGNNLISSTEQEVLIIVLHRLLTRKSMQQLLETHGIIRGINYKNFYIYSWVRKWPAGRRVKDIPPVVVNYLTSKMNIDLAEAKYYINVGEHYIRIHRATIELPVHILL